MSKYSISLKEGLHAQHFSTFNRRKMSILHYTLKTPCKSLRSLGSGEVRCKQIPAPKLHLYQTNNYKTGKTISQYILTSSPPLHWLPNQFSRGSVPFLSIEVNENSYPNITPYINGVGQFQGQSPKHTRSMGSRRRSIRGSATTVKGGVLALQVS